MSISSSTNRSDYVGNGSVHIYNYTFRIFDETDLTVLVRNTSDVETTLALTTDYTVTGVGSSSGGTIVLVNSSQAWLDAGGDLLSDYVLTIRRVLPLVQETDIRNQGAFYPEIHEDQFDKLAMIAQQQGDDIARAMRMPQTVSSVDFNPELPASLLSAPGTTLKVNDAGNGFAAGPTAAVITAAEGYANDAETSKNHAANHVTTASRWAYYTGGTVINADTGADSGEYSAKYYANQTITYSTNAGTSESNAANSASAASTSASNASSSASAASTSASNASSSASAASTSATNASNSASSASTYATNAANSASAASTSATNASNSASSASSSSSSASTFAASALLSATNADNYANAAATSEANALTYAAQAATYMTASQWSDVVYKTFSDSPITIGSNDPGKIYSIDCTSGNVVINLPSIAACDLAGPWSVGIMKTDSSANTVTINRFGTDTIGGSTSVTLVNLKQGYQLIPDTDQTPDQWTALEFGPTTTLYSPTIYTPSSDVITLDGQASTPSNPSSGFYKAYVKDSTGKLTVLDSSGVEKSAGGVSGWAASTPYAVGDLVLYGQAVYSCLTAHTSSTYLETDMAGTSPKWRIVNTQSTTQNLMTFGMDFEDGDIGGWTACGCATVTNGLLASVGSGGAIFSSTNGGRTKGANTTSPAVVSSGQLDGSYSLNFATSGAGTIGDMYISSAYKIPIAFQSTVLQVKFKYKVVSGTPVMAGTSSNTYAAAIYDVDNNAWMPLVGAFNFVQSSGVGTFTGTTQVPYNSTQFQIAIFNPVAPTGASSLYVDNFYVGPQVSANSPAMSDWTSYTPTGAWTTNTTYAGYWRRVGDSLQVNASVVVSGAPTATTFTLNLPSGLVIDTAKIVGTSNEAGVFGTAKILDNGVQFYRPGTVVYSTTTSVKVDAASTSTAATNDTLVSNTAPFTWAANDTMWLQFQVPIVGWSSNSVMSADTSTNVVSAYGTRSASQTGVNPNNSAIKIQLNVKSTISSDTNNLWDTTNYRYNVGVTGKYFVAMAINLDTTNVLNSYYSIGLWVNGTAKVYVARYIPPANTSFTLSASIPVDLVAGDYVEMYLFGNGNNSVSTLTVLGNGSTYMNITRISGPAVITATDNIACRYTTAAAQSITNATTPIINFDTKIQDTTNSVTTGASWKFTAPVPGTYAVNVNVRYANSLAWTLGSYIGAYIYKNGSSYNAADTCIQATNTLNTGPCVQVTDTIQLLAGDYIDIRTTHGESTARALVASSPHVRVDIERLGNY